MAAAWDEINQTTLQKTWTKVWLSLNQIEGEETMAMDEGAGETI